MKTLAALSLAVLCAAASAAPIQSTVVETDKALAMDVLSVETGDHGNAGSGGATVEECEHDVIPEPASLALLGIGLGLAALRRKM